MADPGDDRDRPGVADESVSRSYREAARERAPAALDERIRAAARRKPVRRSWQRPLALAATLALAVSLVLQVTAPGDEPASAPPHGPAHAPAADTPAQGPAEPGAPVTRSPAAGTQRTGRDAAGDRQRLSGSRGLSNYALQPDRPEADAALNKLGRASRKAAESLGGEAAEPVSVRCSEHVDDASAWAACIAALEAAGETAAAERERRGWEARHGQDEAVAR